MNYWKIILTLLTSILLLVIDINQHWWLKWTNGYQESISVLLNFLVFLLLARVLVIVLTSFYIRRQRALSKQKDNVVVGISNLSNLLITGYGIVSFFGLFGINHERLFTSLSIVAAAIAIVSKDFIIEIISGIVISFSNDVTIDDYVKVGEQKGKVIDINNTKTALLNEDDDIVYIPNHKIFLGDIINYTKKEIKKTSIDFELDMKVLRSVDELETILINSLKDYHHLMEPDSYSLKVVQVKKDAVSFKFQYTLNHIDRDLEREIRKKTVRRVVLFSKEQQSDTSNNVK
ncbi:MAG: mechanosensitive ion channel [Saprospiraceae bacterium]|nr:mechanosensitive ion channel [Saprospiraceae bacterium]